MGTATLSKSASARVSEGATRGAIAIPRGCGSRVSNGVYWENGGGTRALEDFIFCPPLPQGALVFPARGVQAIEVGGVTHVLDMVGESYYPNVADFVEEVRVAGLSRRLPSAFPFERLTSQSRILLAHRKAIIVNWRDYFNFLPITAGAVVNCYKECPKCVSKHHKRLMPESFCIKLWWEDLEKSSAVRKIVDSEGWPCLERRMPGFSYYGRTRPKDVKPVYEAGIFMSMPASRLAVVKGDRSDALIEKVRAATVPVVHVDI